MDFLKSQNYIAAHRDETIAEMCRFLQTDTLLFWSDKPDLFAFQQKQWKPILNELNAVFKLDLQITKGLNPPENTQAITELAYCLQKMSDTELTGCFLAALETKSVLLGLLLAKQKISVAETYNAAFLEEIFQNISWGEDTAALNARKITKSHLQQIAEFLNND